MSLSAAGGRYQPIAAQAEITRNCLYDHAQAQLRKTYADDPQSYAGGHEKAFLKVMPGEIVLASRKNGRVTGGYGMGKGREVGMTSLNGLRWGDYGSSPVVAKEAILDDFYHVGPAKTEYEDGVDSFAYSDPLDHGFSAIGSGSYSVCHLGPDPIHAGDLLVLDIPMPGAKSMNVHSKGLLPGKLLPFYRPLRTTDAAPTLECIIYALQTSKIQTPNPGVVGLSPNDIKYSVSLTPLQEEALAMHEFLKKLANNENDNYSFGDSADYITTKKDAFKALFDVMMKTMLRRMGRVVGVSMSSTVQGQTTSVMLSHYKSV